MLDQLVESKSGKGKSRSGFLLTTLVLVSTVMVSAWLYSLFAKNYDMSAEGLDLTTLVAPPVIEEAPEPEPEEEPKPEENNQKDPNVSTRTEVIQDISESPTTPPEKPSVVQNKVPPRNPDDFTLTGQTNSNAVNSPPPDYRGRTNNQGTGSNSGGLGNGGDGEDGSDGKTPPPPPPPPAEKPKPPSRPISGGVLNGKATSLPKPPYPPAAKAVRASGTVSVQVTIDEGGRVISAKAVSGHALLRSAAENAARGARFSPTMLSGQAVKVSGVITYNFVP